MSKSGDRNPPKRPALGKGLNSLLGLGDREGEPDRPGGSARPGNAEGVIRISPDLVESNPHQPRKVFRDQDLKDLSASLKVDGVLQPLIVSKSKSPGRYMLIAGERRLRAAMMAGLAEVPAIVREVSSNDLLRLALIENIQRADLNIIEEAEAYASLIQDYGLTQEECATRVGKDRSTVSNALRILTLPTEIRTDLLNGRLSMGHGRALLSLALKDQILRAREIVVKKELNVRQTEQLCKALRRGNTGEPAPSTPRKNADLDYLADNLRSHLRTKVRLSGTGSRGKIEISYFSPAELERILAMIGSKPI